MEGWKIGEGGRGEGRWLGGATHCQASVESCTTRGRLQCSPAPRASASARQLQRRNATVAHGVEDIGRETNGKAQRAHLDHALILGLGRAPVLVPTGIRPTRQPTHPPLRARILSPAGQERREAPQRTGKRFKRDSPRVIVRSSGANVDTRPAGRRVRLQGVEDWYQPRLVQGLTAFEAQHDVLAGEEGVVYEGGGVEEDHGCDSEGRRKVERGSL